MGMRYQAVAVEASVADELVAEGDDDLIDELLDTGVDLDKMWHAAQIVLAGSMEAEEPLMTGQPVGDDLGYGPAILALPSDVARVAASLEGLTRAQLVDRFDVADMQAQMAYPMVWDEDPDELAQEVADAAMRLVDLYRAAASQGHAILAAIT